MGAPGITVLGAFATIIVGLGDRLVAGTHGVKVLVCTTRATARVALMCV